MKLLVGIATLRHLTLISETGIMLFHTSFTTKEVDEVLLSGFTGAITAIAEQLGDEIHSIYMKNQNFYLHHFKDYIILISTAPQLGEQYVVDRLEILENSSNLITMGTEDNLDLLIEANNELHLEVAELFEMDTMDETLGFESEIDIEEGELFAQVLKELDSII